MKTKYQQNQDITAFDASTYHRFAAMFKFNARIPVLTGIAAGDGKSLRVNNFTVEIVSNTDYVHSITAMLVKASSGVTPSLVNHASTIGKYEEILNASITGEFSYITIGEVTATQFDISSSKWKSHMRLNLKKAMKAAAKQFSDPNEDYQGEIWLCYIISGGALMSMRVDRIERLDYDEITTPTQAKDFFKV